MMDTPRPGRLLWALLAATVLAGLGGCRKGVDLPRTYPVKGKVVYKDGTPLAGGMVDFRPTGQAAGSVSGQIGSDGTFTLTTRTDQGAAPGAPEGQYRVTVMPRFEGDQTKTHGFRPAAVKKTYTVQADDSNDFTITLDQPPPRH